MDELKKLSASLRKELLYFHIDECKKILTENNLDYEKSKTMLTNKLEIMKKNKSPG